MKFTEKTWQETIYPAIGWVGLIFMALANFKFLVGLGLYALWYQSKKDNQ